MSNAIAIASLGLVTFASVWAAKDYIGAWHFAHEAYGSMEDAIKELQETRKELAELKTLVHGNKIQTDELNAQLTITKQHARLAKEGIEKTETNIKTLIENISGDWNNAAHKKDVQILAQAFKELEDLVQAIAIESIIEKFSKEESFDTMLNKADTLEQASKQFACINEKKPEEKEPKQKKRAKWISWIH